MLARGGREVKISTVYIRFFRAFNVDYLLRYHGKSKADAWEFSSPRGTPTFACAFILRSPPWLAPMSPESRSSFRRSSSQSIRRGIDKADFCRYSAEFRVNAGAMRDPEFGLEISDLSHEQGEVIQRLTGSGSKAPRSFRLFRESGGGTTIYLGDGTSATSHPVADSDLEDLEGILPHVDEIDPELALPESVSFRALEADDDADELGREGRSKLYETFVKNSAWWASAETVAANWNAIAGLFRLTEPGGQRTRGAKLARDLLFVIGKGSTTRLSNCLQGA